MSDYNPYLKGLLRPIVLKMLSDEGRMYGYEITQKVKMCTDSKITINEGALYPVLHRLEAEGLIEVEIEMVNNRPRKYYSLTKNGKKESKTVLNEILGFMDRLGFIFNLKTI